MSLPLLLLQFMGAGLIWRWIEPLPASSCVPNGQGGCGTACVGQRWARNQGMKGLGLAVMLAAYCWSWKPPSDAEVRPQLLAGQQPSQKAAAHGSCGIFFPCAHSLIWEM